MMTLKERQIAITEWMGWPKLPIDLNVMHEAENKLTDFQHQQFSALLKHMAAKNNNQHAKYSRIEISPTAQQRAESLCRTLWPERFE